MTRRPVPSLRASTTAAVPVTGSIPGPSPQPVYLAPLLQVAVHEGPLPAAATRATVRAFHRAAFHRPFGVTFHQTGIAPRRGDLRPRELGASRAHRHQIEDIADLRRLAPLKAQIMTLDPVAALGFLRILRRGSPPGGPPA